MSTAAVGGPARMPDDRAASAVRRWVGLYTRGLPASLAADRRALIEADLWDEALAAERLGETSMLTRQRLGRLVRGVPADVTWRLDQQRRTTKMPRRADMRISSGQLVAIGLLTIWQVFWLVALLSQPDFRAWSGMGFATFGLAMGVVGPVLAIPRPQAGFLVGLTGIGMAFVAMPWLFPFYLPLPIVLGYRLMRVSNATQTTSPGV